MAADKISEVRSGLLKAVEFPFIFARCIKHTRYFLVIKGNTCTYTNYYHNIILSFPFKIFVHMMTLTEVLTFINSKVKNTLCSIFLLQFSLNTYSYDAWQSTLHILLLCAL